MTDTTADKRVLIFSPYANWLVHCQVDAFLALSLQLRGADVRLITCDGLYGPRCPAVKGRQDCVSCRNIVNTVPPALLQTPEPLERQLGDDDEALAAAWIDAIPPSGYTTAHFEDLPVGDWALSSTLTQLRSTPEDLAREPAASIYRRYIMDTLKTYWAMSRLITDFKPGHVLLFNGRFYPYRAAVEACRRHGVPFTMHERGFDQGSFMLMENRTVLDLAVYRELYREWRDIALPAPVLDNIAGIFDGRKSGRNLNQYPFHTFSDRKVDVRERLGIPPGKRMIGVFTSSFDELYCCDDYESIDDQVALLDAVFAYFRERDVYVVVRHHPYIGGLSYDIAERTMLCRYYRNALEAPSNVRMVMPKEKLVSYDLFPHLDYAIAPYSTIAIELALDGIPTAIHALTPHAEAFPFTFNRMTREDVFALCDRMEATARTLDPAGLRAAVRYANVQYLLFSWHFKGMGIRDHFVPDLRISHTNDLLPGRDPILDMVCAHILDGAPLHRHPGAEDSVRSTAQEDAFLAERVAALTAARAQARTEAAALPEPDAVTEPLLVAAVCLRLGGEAAPAGVDCWAVRAAVAGSALARVDLTVGHGEMPGAVLARVAAHPAVQAADYVLVHTDREQYDERTLVYAVGALAGDAGLSRAAVGLWIACDGMVYGYLAADRLVDTIPYLPREMRDDPYLPLATVIWRRDAWTAFAGQAAADDGVALVRRLLDLSQADGVRYFPEALGMTWRRG